MMRRHPLRRRRGFALLIALGATVILTLMVYALLASAASETRITTLRKRSLQAESLARAGVARTIADLKNDLIFDTTEGNDAYDGPGDIWADPEEGKEDQPLGRRGDPEDGTFTVEVVDESGLINVNLLGVQSLPLLDAIMRDIGYSEEDAAIAAAAVVDWIDPDDISSGPDGAEEEGVYYARLEAEDGGRRVNRDEDLEPARLRNEALQTVDELLDVYGITPELYFGPGSPEAERYAAVRPKPDRGDRFQIKEKRDRRRDEKPIGLRDYFTTFGSGRLNINTAPAHVLGAYFAAGGATDGVRVAESFARKRGDGRGGRRSSNGVFKTFEELQADGDIYAYVQVAQGAYPADIRSDLFLIRSTGTVRDVSKTVEVLVYRESLILTRDERFEVTDRKRKRERQLGKKRTERRRDSDDESLIRYPAVRIIQWTE